MCIRAIRAHLTGMSALVGYLLVYIVVAGLILPLCNTYTWLSTRIRFPFQLRSSYCVKYTSFLQGHWLPYWTY
jgi:hypothetical protein